MTTLRDATARTYMKDIKKTTLQVRDCKYDPIQYTKLSLNPSLDNLKSNILYNNLSKVLLKSVKMLSI